MVEDWKLKKKLIWNHTILGTMNKDKEVLTKASNDWDNLISSEIEKARKDTLKDLKQELFTFFRWFQWNGEKYMDKPIEEMIRVYLEERKLGDVLGKIEKQIKLEEDKNEGA